MKLLLPKTHIQHAHLQMPIFYLAGPILGGDDWQANAATMLDKYYEGKCLIVAPNWYTKDHRLYQYRVGGDENHFPNNTAWERHYMYAAAGRQNGALIFWLPVESATNPRPRDKGPYAQDTLGEIGEWRGRLEAYQLFECIRRHPYRVVMGAEKLFPGLGVIKKNNELTLGQYAETLLRVCTLEETVSRAIRLQ